MPAGPQPTTSDKANSATIATNIHFLIVPSFGFF